MKIIKSDETSEYDRIICDEYTKSPRNVHILLKVDHEKYKFYGNLYLIEVEKKIVGGFYFYHFLPGIYIFHGVIIQKEYREKGIGNMAISEFLQKYRGFYIVHAVGEVRMFWKKLGFIEIDDKIMVFKNDHNFMKVGLW